MSDSRLEKGKIYHRSALCQVIARTLNSSRKCRRTNSLSIFYTLVQVVWITFL